jgi:hypothetical protein
MVLDQQLLANFSLTAIPTLGMLLVPPCGRNQAWSLFVYALCYVGRWGDLIGFDT